MTENRNSGGFLILSRIYQNIRFCETTWGTFVLTGRSWNLTALTDLNICLVEFIDRNHGPINPA